MKKLFALAFFALLAGAASCSSSSGGSGCGGGTTDPTAGTMTTKNCGAGTHLSGNKCIADTGRY